MHITGIEIKGLPPVGDVSFQFDRRVNLFVGPNASGKSTVLRAIQGWFYESLEQRANVAYRMDVHDINNPGVGTAEIAADLSDDWPKDVSDDEWGRWEKHIPGAVPFFFAPAERINLPHPDSMDRPGGFDTEWVSFLSDVIDFFSNNDTGVFDPRYIEFTLDAGYLSSSDGLPELTRERLGQVLGIGFSCAKTVCSEVIRHNGPHTVVEGSGTQRTVHYGMGIGINDDPLVEPLYVNVLSSGTQGILLWVWALALILANHYNWEEGWEQKPAILLIDEIENHLHPTWQRRVIPALLEHFPGLQIFATTHSPFVVAGLKAGQVHILERDKNGVVTATTNEEDIVGWTMDEVLRNLMGVDDPTDDATAAAARKLRQLRQEAPRSDPAEEEKRQHRMTELRQKVDRDLLAGGPMAAQRELFEQQFSEALEKYRRSKELNQDNG